MFSTILVYVSFTCVRKAEGKIEGGIISMAMKRDDVRMVKRGGRRMNEEEGKLKQEGRMQPDN